MFFSFVLYYFVFFVAPLLILFLLFRKRFAPVLGAAKRFFANWIARDKLHQQLEEEERRIAQHGREKAEAELEEGTGNALTTISEFTKGNLPPPQTERESEQPRRQKLEE